MDNSTTVLVVDDSAEVLGVIESVLADVGADLVLARSGEEALRLALDCTDLAVILLDVSMPGMNGFELAGFLRQRPRFAQTPIIFLTGVAMDQHQVFQGYELGAVDYIFKPVEPHILRSKVRVFVELKQLNEALEERVRERTAQLEAEVQERSRLERQLLQAQKLEAIGQLAGGVAHDFNNMLSVILGYTEMALEALPEDQPARVQIQRVHSAGEKSAALTRQLLAFGRRQILQPRVVDLNQLVASMEGLLNRVLRDDIEIKFKPGSDLGQVKVDPNQTEQTILNLAINARDAMPEGGRLTLETDNVHLDEDYAASHPEVCPGRYVLLAVTDNGHGMDEQTLGRVFDPFFTTKDAGRGTGLGLAGVHGFIKQSGGSIWAYSEPGKGTTFKLYLPRVSETSGPPVTKTMHKPLRGTETVLVVEDNDLVRGLVRETLETSGFTVLEASNGREALDYCSSHAGPIHVAITDLIMPGMGGREFVESIPPERRDMKVIYTSGYAENAIVHQGTLQEGVNFLEKPITPQALVRKVREVLDAEEPTQT